MRVEIEISELAEQMLGDNLKSKIEQLVVNEAMRLWHIERSKPKEKQPVGRPRQSDNEKMVRALGLTLRGIYKRLKELYGPDFEKAFGEQERVLETAIEDGDLDSLIKINTDQPWVRRKH